ncbi:MAG: hypothetical protein CFE31_06370 [Rhizobiales bacterium PAR1]|nr:MAG: hypothetical protein CFE31_06370 [Rhizobiales bacterium PAR1]
MILALVMALLIPARLHALVGVMAPESAVAVEHHHGPSHHSHPAKPQPAQPEPAKAPLVDHAQCLTACLVIPTPEVDANPPALLQGQRFGVAPSRWREGLVPPRLDRPPRDLA